MGIDTIRAIRAAANARMSNVGPREKVSVDVVVTRGALRMVAIVVNVPATVHTRVEVSRTLIPARRAAFGFAAEAPIARPYFVCPKNSHRAVYNRATTTRTRISCPWITTLPICHDDSIGVGYPVTIVGIGRMP